jgi:hypothetical protein
MSIQGSAARPMKAGYAGIARGFSTILMLIVMLIN